MKYIIIWWDRDLYKTNKLSKDIIQGCSDELLYVINLKTSKQLTVFNGKRKWVDIDIWGKE